MLDPDRLRARAREFFGARVDAYQTSESQRTGADLLRALELLAPRAGETGVDLAAGVGHTALAVAARGARVTALDLTPEMLARLVETARTEGIRGVSPVIGDAEAVPLASGTRDFVTCRRAVHHFPDPIVGLREMARLLRPGGRAMFVDMMAPDHPEGAFLFNDLERARDDSHATALSPTQWRDFIAEVGLEIDTLEIQPDRIPWDKWLYPLVPDGPEDRATRRRLAEATPDAAAAVVEDGEDGLQHLKARIVILARK